MHKNTNNNPSQSAGRPPVCRKWLCPALLSALLAGVATLPIAASPTQVNASKPNIVFLLVDDMGYADMPGFGKGMGVELPRLDSLRQQGVSFSNAYVTAPICQPSRAGLQIGRYQQRFGLYTNGDDAAPSVREGLRSATTIAEHLKGAGYATGLIGKWHVDKELKEYGWDEYVGINPGWAMLMPVQPVRPFTRKYKVHDINGKTVDVGEHYTDYFGCAAADFVNRHKDTPFYLSLCFNTPHTPLEAIQEDLDACASVEPLDRRHYCALMRAIDRNVGRVLDALEQAGVAGNTIVVFTNDNGSGGPIKDLLSGNYGDNAPLREGKHTTYEGGVRVPMVMRWPHMAETGTTFNGITSTLDLAPTFLAAAGLPLPANPAFDGVNLAPYLRGEKQGNPHESLVWQIGGQDNFYLGVRRGEWKLVLPKSSDPVKPDAPWELYHLGNDISESGNLAASKPEIVAEMVEIYARWREQMAQPPVLDRPWMKKR